MVPTLPVNLSQDLKIVFRMMWHMSVKRNSMKMYRVQFDVADFPHKDDGEIDSQCKTRFCGKPLPKVWDVVFYFTFLD